LRSFESSPAAILAVFTRGGCPLRPERADALADEIKTYGGLEPAIEALPHDEAYVVLRDALAYRALLHEQCAPELRIGRLLREAQDLDARAAPAWAQAAELRGRAVYRRRQGDIELAAQFQARALAAEALAAELEERALLKRLQAADFKAHGELGRLLQNLAA
jgi:hypothetical protein